MASGGHARILHILKTRGPASVNALAQELGISRVAIRKQLNILEQDDMVRFAQTRGKVGRPGHIWCLTAKGHRRFPDTHDTLTLEMLDGARQVFGPEGLDKMIGAREQAIAQKYLLACRNETALDDRLAILARLRTQEGYMAEITKLTEDSWQLTEAHCPICAVASQCEQFCRSELIIFQKVLGLSARIERTAHIPAGANHCAYLIHRTTHDR